ncbi:hypothetical protein KFK09_005575 [Dendrobium nobile]|uniref:Uncharacterized protein n=1 Tax=Dendrobium nobile TaxID=94219 RepID=A0A8T3C0X0_DENNO|nr:hypothetical protein KFK09_005575 [Dendrobium nobile]
MVPLLLRRISSQRSIEDALLHLRSLPCASSFPGEFDCPPHLLRAADPLLALEVIGFRNLETPFHFLARSIV